MQQVISLINLQADCCFNVQVKSLRHLLKIKEAVKELMDQYTTSLCLSKYMFRTRTVTQNDMLSFDTQ